MHSCGASRESARPTWSTSKLRRPLLYKAPAVLPFDEQRHQGDRMGSAALRSRPVTSRTPVHPTKGRTACAVVADRRPAALEAQDHVPEERRSPSPGLRIDPRLRGVHAVLERWAASFGPDERLAGVQAATVVHPGPRPHPLGDADRLIVDRVYNASPAWARHFVKLRYRAQATAEELQDVLGLTSRQAVYRERQIVLMYFLGRLVSAGMQPDPRRDDRG